MNINSGVYGVILNEKNEILLIHRTDHDIWEIPGGKWEDGETPWDAIIREIKEETGLDVEVIKIVSIDSRPSNQDLVFTFQCKVIGGEIARTSEANKIEYCSIENFPSNIAPPKVARIKDALLFEDKCLLRNIDKSVKTEDYIAKNNL